jgi:hypothetical protein
MTTQSVIDADGHVLEPADTWLKYLDPHYRDRAIRIARDEQGLRGAPHRRAAAHDASWPARHRLVGRDYQRAASGCNTSIA